MESAGFLTQRGNYSFEEESQQEEQEEDDVGDDDEEDGSTEYESIDDGEVKMAGEEDKPDKQYQKRTADLKCRQ